MSDRETARKRIRKFLDEEREHYKELSAKLEDPKRILALLYELYVYLEPITTITGDDPPHKSVFAVAQVKGGIDEVFSELAFYKDYQMKQQALDQITNDENESGWEHSANPDGSVEMAVT